MTDISESQVSTSWFHAIAGWVREIRGQRQERRSRRLARIELREWSDHLLRDIGLQE